MKQTLSRSEMLSLWRTRRAIEPPRLDCSVERADGPDVDTILVGEMRAWYLHKLDTAPVAQLAPVMLLYDVLQVVSYSGRLAVVKPPEDTRRVLHVYCQEWSQPVEPVSTPEQVARAAANPLWRRPLAAMMPDGSVMVAPCKGFVTEMTVITDPGPETYEFDDSIWNEPTF